MANADQAATADKLAADVPASTPDQERAAAKRAAAYAEAAGVDQEARSLPPEDARSGKKITRRGKSETA